MTNLHDATKGIKSSSGNYFPRRSMVCLRDILFASIFILSFQAAIGVADIEELRFCQPLDPASCRYGGECTTATAFPQLTPQFSPDKYLCYCEPINCLQIAGYHPICVTINGKNHTLMNQLCVRKRECKLQSSIRRICEGECGSPSCITIEKDGLDCDENDSVNYCFNYGTCRRSAVNSTDKYCRCPDGYTGHRCQNSKPRTPPPTTSEKEHANFKLAFFVCAGVLLLTLFLQTIYCMARCFGSKNKCKEFDCEDRRPAEGVGSVNVQATRMALEGVVVDGRSANRANTVAGDKGTEQR